jgi:hypothetical protein
MTLLRKVLPVSGVYVMVGLSVYLPESWAFTE